MSNKPVIRGVRFAGVANLFPYGTVMEETVLEFSHAPLDKILKYYSGTEFDGECLVIIVNPSMYQQYHDVVCQHYHGEVYLSTHPNVATFRVFCGEGIHSVKPLKRRA